MKNKMEKREMKTKKNKNTNVQLNKNKLEGTLNIYTSIKGTNKKK
jgi:hypothetical protein|tara:strand:- start:239 stop:373 length:135 start_codon:yes stop_codon:yes gene_type:complete